MTKIEEISKYTEELKGLKNLYKELWNCKEFTRLNIMGQNELEINFSLILGFNAHHNISENILEKNIRDCIINLQEMVLSRRDVILNEINELVNNILTKEDLDDAFWSTFKINPINNS